MVIDATVPCGQAAVLGSESFLTSVESGRAEFGATESALSIGATATESESAAPIDDVWSDEPQDTATHISNNNGIFFIIECIMIWNNCFTELTDRNVVEPVRQDFAH